MALPKKFQLSLNRKTILAFRKKGRPVQASSLSGYYLVNELQENRFAIVVGGAISKKAVVRNKIRRSIQQVLLTALPKERRVDMILYPKKGIVNLSKDGFDEEVKKLLQQIT